MSMRSRPVRLLCSVAIMAAGVCSLSATALAAPDPASRWVTVEVPADLIGKPIVVERSPSGTVVVRPAPAQPAVEVAAAHAPAVALQAMPPAPPRAPKPPVAVRPGERREEIIVIEPGRQEGRRAAGPGFMPRGPKAGEPQRAAPRHRFEPGTRGPGPRELAPGRDSRGMRNGREMEIEIAPRGRGERGMRNGRGFDIEEMIEERMGGRGRNERGMRGGRGMGHACPHCGAPMDERRMDRGGLRGGVDFGGRGMRGGRGFQFEMPRGMGRMGSRGMNQGGEIVEQIIQELLGELRRRGGDFRNGGGFHPGGDWAGEFEIEDGEMEWDDEGGWDFEEGEDGEWESDEEGDDFVFHLAPRGERGMTPGSHLRRAAGDALREFEAHNGELRGLGEMMREAPEFLDQFRRLSPEQRKLMMQWGKRFMDGMTGGRRNGGIEERELPRMRREAAELGDSIEDLGTMLKDLEREIDGDQPRRPGRPSIADGEHREFRMALPSPSELEEQLNGVKREIEKLTASITEKMTEAQLDEISKRLDELEVKSKRLEAMKARLKSLGQDRPARVAPPKKDDDF